VLSVWLQWATSETGDIKKGQCPSSPSLSNVNECVSDRESKEYVEGLNSKVNLWNGSRFQKVPSWN